MYGIYALESSAMNAKAIWQCLSVWLLYQIDIVFLGDSLTLKWNEYPAAFWCESFSGDGECLSNIRPIFEQYFGWKYNAVALGIAGDFFCLDGPTCPTLCTCVV